MQALGRTVLGFARATKGNVAILFGLALIPVMLGVGIAVDYGRALIVRERMLDAADAAALAVGSWPGLTEAELKTKAQQFFAANYPPSSLGTVGSLDVSFADNDIHVTVEGSLPTTFMRLANVSHMDVGASTTVTKRERNIELALVLDTTGSMASSGKMSAMQRAANKLVETLFGGKSTSDTLKIGVVPFSGAVNIGANKINSGWLDKGTHPNMSEIAGEDFDFSNRQNVLTLYDDLRNESWAGCVRERDGRDYQLTDAPPRSGVRDSLFAPYFAPDEPDSGGYQNDYLDDGNCGVSSNSGPGRGGGRGRGRGGGGGNSNPEPAECQRYTGKYEGERVSGGNRGPDFNCPPQSVTPLTDRERTVTSAIDDLEPNGNTVIPAGLLWGWRLVSPGEPFTEGKPYGDEKWIKAIVLLTDGENMVSGGGNGHNESVYNAFGYAAEGHLGNRNGRDAEEKLNEYTEDVCDAIKSNDVLLYTIGFRVNDSATHRMLRDCATKPDMYYNSPSNEQLETVFADIAQGLSELRIAK